MRKADSTYSDQQRSVSSIGESWGNKRPLGFRVRVSIALVGLALSEFIQELVSEDTTVEF